MTPPPKKKIFLLKAGNMVENLYLYVLSNAWYVSISDFSFLDQLTNIILIHIVVWICDQCSYLYNKKLENSDISFILMYVPCFYRTTCT